MYTVFLRFQVLSVLYSPSPLMPLLTLGVQTALVVDVGFAEVTVVPVFEGVPVLKAWQAQPMASEAVHGAIRTLLEERGTVRIGDAGSVDTQKLSEVQPKMEISDEIIEDIKGKEPQMSCVFVQRSCSNAVPLQRTNLLIC